MKHLVDLEFIANSIKNSDLSPDVVLDSLYKHACELQLITLIEAIEIYRQSKSSRKEDAMIKQFTKEELTVLKSCVMLKSRDLEDMLSRPQDQSIINRINIKLLELDKIEKKLNEAIND